MFRRLSVLAVMATCSVFISVPSNAAPSPRCHGQAATIVGSAADTTLNGTSGDDVIITNGAGQGDGVFAGDGDDLICVTGVSRNIDAGPGDDTVDTTDAEALPPSLNTYLGPGADQFIGGPAFDRVYTGDTGGNSARDVVDTGAGGDVVWTGDSTDPLGSNTDKISLGADPDDIHVYGLGASIDGGPGPWVDQMYVAAARGATSVSIDTKKRRVLVGTGQNADQLVSAYKGTFTWFRATTKGPDSVWNFTGTDRDEYLYLGSASPEDSPSASINFAGGNDRLTALHPFAGLVAGGPGTDKVIVPVVANKRVFADITKGVEIDGVPALKFRGLQKLRVNATTAPGGSVEVVGGSGDNWLRADAIGARIVLRGKGGSDDLMARSDVRPRLYGGPGRDQLHGTVQREYAGVNFYGGSGNDQLLGGPRKDRLYGQGGHDRANGLEGNDVCVAEVRISCHRP